MILHPLAYNLSEHVRVYPQPVVAILRFLVLRLFNTVKYLLRMWGYLRAKFVNKTLGEVLNIANCFLEDNTGILIKLLVGQRCRDIGHVIKHPCKLLLEFFLALYLLLRQHRLPGIARLLPCKFFSESVNDALQLCFFCLVG